MCPDRQRVIGLIPDAQNYTRFGAAQQGKLSVKLGILDPRKHPLAPDFALFGDVHEAQSRAVRGLQQPRLRR